MTWRHTHVTQFLYAGQEDKARFVAALRKHFRWVYPIPSEDRISWVTFMDKDMNDQDDERDMPGVLDDLEGILPADIEIVSAWETEDAPLKRTRVWLVRGYDPGELDLRDRAAKYLDAEEPQYPREEKPYGTSNLRPLRQSETVGDT